jgi:hypothetical protein
MKLLVMQFSQFSCHFLPTTPKSLLSTLFPDTCHCPFHMVSKSFISMHTHLYTYKFTDSMVQDILSKVHSHSACQRISCFLYGTRRLIAVLKKARHWTLSWASRIQFAPSIPISLSSILMLSFYLLLGLPSGLFLSGLPTKTL